MRPLKSKTYASRGGVQCPFCRSEWIEGAGVEILAGKATQLIFCDDCDSTWTDEYKLIGYITTDDQKED